MSVVRFIQYNNAVPIVLGVLFLGFGVTFASTNPDAIYQANQTVISVDNTYIANKDLSNWTPEAIVFAVTEDDSHYFVEYQFTTIALEDSIWQDSVMTEIMKVSKADLGEFRDLGLYVTQQLKQHIDRELDFLKEVQQIENRNVTQKTVATEYGGLVGALLTDKTETLPGYTPVVTAKPVFSGAASAGVSLNNANTNTGSNNNSQQQPSSSEENGILSYSPGGPIIQILGNNPAIVSKGAHYSDLGATVSDDKDRNIGLDVLMSGVEVPIVDIDTSTTSDQRIVYKATDTDGNVTEVYRRVIVYDPREPVPQVESIPKMQVPSTGSSPPSPPPPPPPEPPQDPTPEPAVPQPSATSSPSVAEGPNDPGEAATSSPSVTEEEEEETENVEEAEETAVPEETEEQSSQESATTTPETTATSTPSTN